MASTRRSPRQSDCSASPGPACSEHGTSACLETDSSSGRRLLHSDGVDSRLVEFDLEDFWLNWNRVQTCCVSGDRGTSSTLTPKQTPRPTVAWAATRQACMISTHASSTRCTEREALSVNGARSAPDPASSDVDVAPPACWIVAAQMWWRERRTDCAWVTHITTSTPVASPRMTTALHLILTTNDHSTPPHLASLGRTKVV